MHFTTRLNLCFLVAAAVVGTACRDREPAVPPAQAQTATTQPANQPTTVTGCLRAGEAENTFVLTTAKTVDGAPTATYHLAGSAGVNLLDHIDRRVEVSGVIDQQSQIATREPAQPAEKATGTGGTAANPTVQTGTELAIKRLEVSSVKRVGGDCEL
jgi:hypothetical protein